MNENVIDSTRILLTEQQFTELSRQNYSKMLLSTSFWNQCKGNNILIFQMDTCLNRNLFRKTPQILDNFLKWDYIGAPWSNKRTPRSLLNSKKRVYIGNGGLSLRRKSTMIHVCDILQKRYSRKLLSKNYNEDLVISSILQTFPFINTAKIPDQNIAKQFSVETMYQSGVIGVHKPWEYLNKVDFSKLSREIPEIVELFQGKFY